MKGKIVLLLVIALVLSGCYFRDAISENEVGLQMPGGARVEEVVGAGLYTDMGIYAKMVVVDMSAKTIIWDDPDLVTSDKQPIGLNISVTYNRGRTCVTDMFRDYRAEATSDEALASLVSTRIPRVAKALTTEYTLDEMLGVVEDGEFNRSIVQNQLFELLTPELDEFCVVLKDVGINNISPSETYLSLLEEKSNAQVSTEVSRQRTLQLREQLNQEQAQTAIEIEKAERQNSVNAALAQSYEDNDRYYELERLKLLGDVVGPNDKIYFVPEGTDLSIFLGNNGVPVVPGGSND